MKTGRFWFVLVAGLVVGVAASVALAQSSERGIGSRTVMLGAYGDTKQSGRTVSRALYWLACQQNADGSWSFDAGRPDKAAYANPGKCRSKCGATALALLCFAGVGLTHG